MWTYLLVFSVAFALEFAGAAYTLSLSRLEISHAVLWSGVCSVLSGVAIINLAEDWTVLPVYMLGEVLATYCVLRWAERQRKQSS